MVSAVAATGHPALGTVLAAALVVGGGLALAAQRRTAPPPFGPGGHQHGGGRSLLGRTFVVLIGVNLGIGAYFGAIQVAVTAFAVESGAPGDAVPLYAVSSGAGLLAGWLYGLRRWRTPPIAQLALATTGLALACLLLVTANSPLTVAVGLAATGLAVPPILALCSVIAERSVPRTVLTQAFTWLNSASAAGTAGTAAISGRVIRHPRQPRRLHHRRHSRHHHHPPGDRTPDNHNPTPNLKSALHADGRVSQQRFPYRTTGGRGVVDWKGGRPRPCPAAAGSA